MKTRQTDFIAGRLFVFDMDGTLLPKTSACLEIARATDTLPTLVDLERQFMEDESTPNSSLVNCTSLGLCLMKG
jgi:phosphoserine phosphatase